MAKPPKYKKSDYIPYKDLSRTPGATTKALRELHEWSQVEVAEMTGISQATISSLETGRTALVHTAKKPETRQNRMNKILEILTRGERFH